MNDRYIENVAYSAFSEEKDSIQKSTTDNTQSDSSLFQELKRLNVRRRNQIRSILYATIEEAIKIQNKIRKTASAKELYCIEKILCSSQNPRGMAVPSLFPKKSQTTEDYHRLELIPFDVQMSIIEMATKDNFIAIQGLTSELAILNQAIINKNIEKSDQLIGQIYNEFGYSHLLLRKAGLVQTFNADNSQSPNINSLFVEAGIGKNNVIATSLLHCYQEEKNFLSIKRSIMSLRDRGVSNKYTRDISRIPFHPIYKSRDDLAEALQSGLQSSLIDALILIKINRHLFNLADYEIISESIDLFDNFSIDQIARSYIEIDDGESLFYKHSCAWLESEEIIKYRNLVDHFYDAPESPYFEINENVLDDIKLWVGEVTLSDLAENPKISSHSHQMLQAIESSGNVTRSAVFNYLVHICEGWAVIEEAQLVRIMEKTRDLDRTVNVSFVKRLAQNTSSKISKIIYYLLIAKKSKNEADNHQLRRILQDLIKSQHDGKLLGFITGLSKISQVISEYTYEVCTEDFIAKLSHIISTASEITEARAELHKWMGEVSGEKAYLDRARTLLIDHQINKIRNEIDDNRIYVDAARFAEWINDELLRDINSALTSLEHNIEYGIEDEPQLLYVLDRSYAEFCQNSIFGIASYLGRRIRHGTFKGHLYSGVIALESKYENLLGDPVLLDKWSKWKIEYERQVDEIIRERLHVESNTKRAGLINPSIRHPAKAPIVSACMHALANDYKENKSSATAIQLLTEYCWRLAEVDLRNINSYLKGRKTNLLGTDFITSFKSSAGTFYSAQARDFTRDLQHEINERLQTMYGWFKRPLSVSPKASLSLLFKAVVAEVKQVFDCFDTDADFDETNDIELIGGAYHVLYDAFYVVVYNAAKHGKIGGRIWRDFKLVYNSNSQCIEVLITVRSLIRDTDTDLLVNERLAVLPEDDIVNAQLSETRSGIKKLHHLQSCDSNFSILKIRCEDRSVVVMMSYKLEH